MKGLLLVLLSIVVTIFCWGTYGPILKEGQVAMHSGLRPFICVGLAYFIIAVVAPILLLQTVGEKGHWSTMGLFWSLVAGVSTAVGALGIILAVQNRGSPLYIMPLVFGLAPVVNSFTTIVLGRTYSQINSVFIAGLILVVAGAVTVLMSAPRPQATVSIDRVSAFNVTVTTKTGDTSTTNVYSADDREQFAKKFPLIYRDYVPKTLAEWTLVLAFTLLTAVCWGLYGPVLHKGQMAMAGSRLRPLLCVGLAYFLIAVLVPAILLGIRPDEGHWVPTGVMWSLGAGAVGAIGALGVIMAFNFGGKPVYVMPLIFGGAPIVNTFVEVAKNSALSHISSLFIAGLIMTGVGAMTVLAFAPRGHGPAHPPQKPTTPATKEPAVAH